MPYDILLRQARAASLGFWPGPIDGKDGPRTRKAIADATAAQAAKGLPFIHPSGLVRLHLHWSAGAYAVSALDKQHYHYTVDGDGKVARWHEPTEHLAHTLNANTGSVAIAACAMAGACDRPFTTGKYPLRTIQIDAMANVAAELCRTYDIPVSRYSVLTHAEVQPTLGIRQRGKIDIMWLPVMPAMGNPVDVGDRLRDLIARKLSA